MKQTFLPILLICIIVGCSPRSIISTLNDVDFYIMERPDSALQVLESMDRSLLKTEKSRAHHALLHAMALDKNYIDVTDDSIAQVAVDYYSRRGPEKSKARAYYYLGLAYYYQQNYDKAILEFTKAEEVAETCDSLYWGMTKDIQGHTYDMTYNDIEVINCFKKAYYIYSGLLDNHKAQSVQFKLAQVYISDLQYEIADNILTILLNDSNLNENLRLRTSASYAYLKMIQPVREPNQSIELYEELIDFEDVMTTQDYWAYAFALNIVGRTNESKEIIDKLIAKDTTTASHYWLYLISKYDGNYRNALSYLEESNFHDNKIT